MECRQKVPVGPAVLLSAWCLPINCLSENVYFSCFSLLQRKWGTFLLQVACGVKVYLGQALFFKPYVFLQFHPNYVLALQQRIWHYRVSLVKKNRMMLNAPKKAKFDLRPIWFHRSNQIKAGHIRHYSILEHKKNTLVPISFVYHLWFKSYGQESHFPTGS